MAPVYIAAPFPPRCKDIDYFNWHVIVKPVDNAGSDNLPNNQRYDVQDMD